MTIKTSRRIFALVFLGCVALVGLGYYVEYVEGVMPCPLCIMQRFAYCAVGIIALLACLHRYKACGGRVYAFLGLVFSCAGLGMAWRQVWLQHAPSDSAAACIPGLTYLYKTFPFFRATKMALQGSAECGQIHWTLWGYSMAEWSLCCFILLAVVMFWILSAPCRAKG
jgi:protein dithiol:quinone oxidoreductase